MQRVNPLITLPGLALWGLLVIGLGAALWFHGGEAFSPGKLSSVHPNGEMMGGFESHAEFEHQCKLCHQPLTTTQDVLCRDCHTAIDEQITSQNGLHSIVDTATQTCRECHPDHRGREFSPGLAAIPFFDHTATAFSLAKHQLDYQAAPLDCKACHTSLQSGNFSPDENTCQDCHTVENAAFMQNHILDFGPTCLACHDGLDTLAAFDHVETRLPLVGKHANLMCSSCHLTPAENGFAGLETECAACHTEPDLHKALFSNQCQDCHTPDGWLPAALNGQPFDHTAAGFTLERHVVDFSGSPMNCTACHLAPLQPGDGASMPTCLDCHTEADPAYMQAHVAQFGNACLNCHDGSDNLHNFDHSSVFVLDGAHASLDCTACHPTGNYKGTPTLCADCHAADTPMPTHYPGECSLCHTPESWETIVFEHTGYTDCLACHTPNKPANHYPGQCSTCHTTNAWTPATFNHTGYTDCLSCHTPNKPTNHYPGQCSTCHTTNAWTPATFNHTGYTDCLSCHTPNKPTNHYPGQCSTCHTTNAWTPATFNHTGYTDCLSCHTPDKPANHYDGVCSTCHTTSAWLPANFNHTGYTDCLACHIPDKPANHYDGVCSTCHTTSAWLPANFNHTGYTDCLACHIPDKPANHYDGVCSTCHTTNAWLPANFNHTSYTDCLACHIPDKPTNHYDGVCSTCHTTSAWIPATFNHTGYTDCLACHIPDKPANHYDGVCSTCHTTSAWLPVDVPHTFPTNHGDANNQCAVCHPSGGSAWTCYTCHDRIEMEEEHANEGIVNIDTRCLECHPTGQED